MRATGVVGGACQPVAWPINLSEVPAATLGGDILAHRVKVTEEGRVARNSYKSGRQQPER